MNKDINITINGKPAYSIMMKYKTQRIAANLGQKILSDVVPKIDTFFETQGGYSK